MSKKAIEFGRAHALGVAAGAFTTSAMTYLEWIQPTAGQQFFVGIGMLLWAWFLYGKRTPDEPT